MKLSIRLTPGASRDGFEGRTEDGAYRVRVQAPPVEGAANRRLVRFLSEKLGIPKTRIRIVAGKSSRRKVLDIDGDAEEIIRRLEGCEE
jgi:uncharacterized protein